MALSDFVNTNIERLSKAMARLAHNTMMGDNGNDETVLIAMGKYRQLKSERDYWMEFRKKRTSEENRLEEMPDDDGEDELPPPEEQPRRRAPRARQWGGGV